MSHAGTSRPTTMNTPPSGFAAAIAAHHAAGQKTRHNHASDLRLPPAPSLRTLAAAFGDDSAPLLRRILKSRSRSEILALSSDAAELERRSYGRQSMQSLRFAALSQVLGGFDAESFRTRKGEWVTYVNMGDTYTTTLVKFRGTYRVSDWGSIAEKHGDWQG